MARVTITADMHSLIQRIKKEGFVTKQYVMKTPMVSKTLKALIKHGFVEGIGSDHRTFELTDLGKQLSELTPRFSGESALPSGELRDSWQVIVDGGTVTNPKEKKELRKDYRKTYPITETRTLQETQDKKESGFKSKFLASSSSADSKRYYRAVAQALGGTLSSYEEGKEMKRIKIRTKDMNLEILQSWRRDGSESKPVTILNFDDGSMNLGRFSIWAGKPEMYAEDIQNALSKHNKTEEN